MELDFVQAQDLTVADFVDVLRRSGLAERRPVADAARVARMLAHSNLIIVAREGRAGKIIGVARSVTDFSFCCYLSDLAVDRAFQGQGVGKRLIAETRKAAGPEAMCLLLSAPEAMGFYQTIGMPQADNAFIYTRER